MWWLLDVKDQSVWIRIYRSTIKLITSQPSGSLPQSKALNAHTATSREVFYKHLNVAGKIVSLHLIHHFTLKETSQCPGQKGDVSQRAQKWADKGHIVSRQLPTVQLFTVPSCWKITEQEGKDSSVQWKWPEHLLYCRALSYLLGVYGEQERKTSCLHGASQLRRQTIKFKNLKRECQMVLSDGEKAEVRG